MMTFLVILAAIICLITGFIAGLFVFVFVNEKTECIVTKNKASLDSPAELKNFFNYDGTNQE